MSMSTQDWIATLGLFLTHPELPIATFIGMGAASGFAWWLRGYIDRAHIDTLKSRVDSAEAALRENEQLKQRVEALERENTGLRRQIPLAKETVILDDDTNRVLDDRFQNSNHSGSPENAAVLRA